MKSKFTKPELSPLLNPVDWFNFYGDFTSIFKNAKKLHSISATEVANTSNMREVVFKLLPNGLVDIIGENDYDIATGAKISKFMLLSAVGYKGDYFGAMSFVRFFLMKEEIPYIRVGGDYFKLIKKEDRYGGINTLIKAWKKDEIKEDHSKEIIKHVYKYDDFDIIPNNKTFVPVRNGCYNLYSRFAHDPFEADISINDIPFTIGIIKHIFGEQMDLGMKYMKLLYENPKQILPILALVSTERGTGKTTFLNWIHMIFGENTVNISPQDLTSSFNSIYATKNIIMVDETVVEKSTTVEKLKSLATAKSISVSQKFVSEYSIPFFGKIILCTNKEKDFMRIDEEEVRFWVRKISPVTTLNTNIENDLFDEIPKFLRYLTQLPEIDLTKSRMVFTMAEIQTIQLDAIKEESKSGLNKEIEILIDNFFANNTVTEFKAGAIDIKEKFFNHNNTISINYIRKVLKEEMKLQPEQLQKYYPFAEVTLNSKAGTPFLFKSKNTQSVDNQIDNDIPF